ncbi:MAG: hypothetical protein L0J45_01365 [Psychroflexus sp.]|nr:hypothetical protein [Psychroflexus sp.]MDN6309492.1 hypothetical protein [Psychroflexus sp.]
MKTLRTLALLCIAIIAVSCKGNQKSKIDSEFKKEINKAIEVHDDVMPKMSEINQKIRSLDTLAGVDSLTIEKSKKRLKDAHEEMMTWMRDFSNAFSTKEIKEGLQTDKADSIKIKTNTAKNYRESALKMKESVNSSIEEAKKLLNNI